MAMLLMRSSGAPLSSGAYGMTEPKGWPGCRRESVESAPERARWTRVRARSA